MGWRGLGAVFRDVVPFVAAEWLLVLFQCWRDWDLLSAQKTLVKQLTYYLSLGRNETYFRRTILLREGFLEGHDGVIFVEFILS